MAPTLYHTRDAPESTGFQREPSGRGTIGIIWTCLSTILLCSWSSYHDDAYNPNNSVKYETYKAYAIKFSLAFLLPEIGAVLSFHNLYDALQLRKTVRQLGGPQFASFSLSQAFLILIDGVRQKEAGSETTTLIGHGELVELVRSCRLSFSDLPSDDEIADKSKRDWTLKALAVIQTSWFIAGIIARLSQGYPVSLYEDITLANAVCGVVEFACWFHCPQNIRLPYIIRPGHTRLANSPCAAAENEELGREPAVNSGWVSESATRPEASSKSQLPALSDARTEKEDREMPITERLLVTEEGTRHGESHTAQPIKLQEMSVNVLMPVLVAFSLVFSGIHIAAWNYSFCSLAEAWIWRGGSLGLAILVVLFPILVKSQEMPGGDILLRGNIVLYPIVRTMMFIVALMAFRKAPTRLYETPSWTQYWPHI
ncbi:hypothetical protein B0T20DRAFT_66896 [Sordaria brevicollis]|uniref:Uncharacterized protein n=1 Tax=Sordaria brevicollis TaxID=83679 RepID=A0AAE0U5P7_SORBR|nr:hypothetical protein B0T20DRAFT_66896 [Sordaria brevicollis]